MPSEFEFENQYDEFIRLAKNDLKDRNQCLWGRQRLLFGLLGLENVIIKYYNLRLVVTFL